MLQSIGMTARQLKQMLICEGLFYGILAILASAVLSFFASPLLGNTASSMFWFFRYHFTLLPLLAAIPIFAALGVLLPLASYRYMARQTLVERLAAYGK